MNPVSRKSLWLQAALAALFALLVSLPVLAQRADGNIGGDAAPGDKVLIVNVDTGFKREAITDEDGRYRFRSVPLGTYQVRVSRGENLVLNAAVTVRPGGTARPPKTPAATPPSTGE